MDYARFFTHSLEMLATANADGYFVELNPVWERVLGWTVDELKSAPFVTFIHPEDIEPTVSVAADLFTGKRDVVDFVNRYRCKSGDYKWLQWVASAVHGGGDGLTYACARDVTPHKHALAELERALADRAEYESEYRRVAEDLQQRIDAQQDAIHSMSTPIIQVWDDIVTMPVVGLVDSARAADMKTSLLETVARTGAKFAIVDLTGVDVLDTATADHLLKVMAAVGLLGARCILTGIQPSVAQIVVSLGVDMQGVVTLRSLREGLKFCMRKMGYRVNKEPEKPLVELARDDAPAASSVSETAARTGR
jgi:PAS domain S-box-containing protein